MSNAKEMDKLAAEAKAGASVAGLETGIARGTVAGYAVTAYANPVNTNGRQLIQLNWYLEGKKVGKAVIAALVAAPVEAATQTDEGPVASEGSEAADEASLKEMLEVATQVEGATALKAAIASGLSKCAAMRAVAKDWKGDRKSYLTAMKAEGMNAATSANSWLNGRK